jgi:lipopolysaccharide/colanic/teichoic acid biosynthesis glycosyltransferase
MEGVGRQPQSAELMLLDSSISKSAGSVPKPAAKTSGRHFELFLKRCLDLAGAVLLILVLLPVFFILALFILFDDGRPIFYRRRVVGKTGEFDAFKFRSMRRDADDILKRDPALKSEFEQNFKLRADPRLTKAGATLRKHSLDELPQLFNVVLGQMSLVGPRMITAPELEKYGSFRENLLSVRPGITGYWQVNGRQEVAYQERVAMDMHYIDHWSLWLDLRILLLTPWKVIKGEGAY